MSNWQQLCKTVKTYTGHPKQCAFRKEECFEDHFVEYLRNIFGWGFEEVHRQYPVKFGHENKRADIVLLYDSRPAVIFELKAYGQPLAGEEIGQLTSYMKQMSAEFGILTNSVALQLYWQPLGNRDETKMVLNLRFDENDPDGVELGKLLNRANFAENRLTVFCQELQARLSSNRNRIFEFQPKVPNDFIAEQMSIDLDDKMVGLIRIYLKHIESDEYERAYFQKYARGIKWVQENVLAITNKNFSDQDYKELVHQIPRHLANLNNGAHRVLYTGLDGSRKKFIAAVTYLANANEDQKFIVMQNLLENPDYKIKGMARSFWSEMVRVKFPDMPLVNSKTIDFFVAIGLNISYTPDKQAQNVYYCYTRWQALCRQKYGIKVSILELSHLENFAKEVKAGRDYIKAKFNTEVGSYE